MLKTDNLLRLAAYLETLPDDYAAFEMKVFIARNDHYLMRLAPEVENRYALKNGGVASCGAVACAVGHGPSAGMLMPESMTTSGSPDWFAYVDHYFIDGYLDASEDDIERRQFAWMFGDSWTDVDNTPKGAAKRIRWLIAGNELPYEYDDIEMWDINAREEYLALYM